MIKNSMWGSSPTKTISPMQRCTGLFLWRFTGVFRTPPGAGAVQLGNCTVAALCKHGAGFYS